MRWRTPATAARGWSRSSGSRGCKVSSGGVRGVWQRHNLLTKHERLLDAEAGECQYRTHRGQLEYVALNVAVYNDSSDIVVISSPDVSILCAEVLEHLPDHIKAFCELRHLLRPRGEMIVTVPLWSLMHKTSFNFATDIDCFLHEHHLIRHGLDAFKMTLNVNFFECVGQEVRRVWEMALHFANDAPTALEIYATQITRAMVQWLSATDSGSAELLHYDYQIRSIKRNAG